MTSYIARQLLMPATWSGFFLSPMLAPIWLRESSWSSCPGASLDADYEKRVSASDCAVTWAR